MDKELNNDQNGFAKPSNDVADGCTKCNENPCVCSANEKASSKEKPARTMPPKISWI